jgi:hypothetical protein
VKLVFIGGAQRSGTTLVQTLIANALNVKVLPEAHILSDILAAYKKAKASHKTPCFYQTSDDLRAFFQLIALRHLDDIVRANPQPVLVLKDPNFVLVLDEIAAIFSEATVVVCVRDPRDIAASFLRIGYRHSEQNVNSKYRSRDVGFICKKIVSSYSDLLQSPDGENFILAQYEEIVRSPREWLEDFAREAALELSLNRIDDPEWLPAHLRHDPTWVTELEEQKPSALHVGAFRQIMKAHEIALVQKICAPIMRWIGYEPISVSAIWLPLQRVRDYLKRRAQLSSSS